MMPKNLSQLPPSVDLNAMVEHSADHHWLVVLQTAHGVVSLVGGKNLRTPEGEMVRVVIEGLTAALDAKDYDTLEAIASFLAVTDDEPDVVQTDTTPEA